MAMTNCVSPVTFIMTMTDEQEPSIQQASALFKFSERHEGVCEILILVGDVEELNMKLTWLSMTLNKMTHPKVRARMIRYTSQEDLINQIDSNIHIALGRKILVFTNCSPIRERIENIKEFKNGISAIKYTLEAKTIQRKLDQVA